MTEDIKDLCRLCAKRDEFSKELLDENNTNTLKMVQDLIQIMIYDNDKLPTKICLNCEEKVVSFQLFIVECYKVQDTLKNMWLEICNKHKVKLEGDDNYVDATIKSEVKMETSGEDIISALSDPEALSNLIVIGKQNNSHVDDSDNNVEYENNEDSDDGDYADDITLITYKKMKSEDKLKAILEKPCPTMKDFVKYQCPYCRKKIKNWENLAIHCDNKHDKEPYVKCVCDFEIRSRNILYKHIKTHKQESRNMKKNSNEDSSQDINYNSSNFLDLKAKDLVSFTCVDCAKVCSSWYTLKAHCARIHKIPPVVKCACGSVMKSKSVMYKHIQDHKNPNVLACDVCRRIFPSQPALIKHKMRHVPKEERMFQCTDCDKIFKSKDGLKSHSKSHIPIEKRKIYHCESCDMKFTTKSSAASHKRIVHDKIKSCICDLCGYACATNGELRQHRAIHSDEKPFICIKCSKSFKTYSNLKTHMDIHEDTSYECYVCRRVLNSRRTLRKHLLVHDEQCNHVCSYCNKAFKRRQTLKVHMHTHTGDKPLSCKWCDERFAYASTLRSHRLRCHPEKMAGKMSGEISSKMANQMADKTADNPVANKVDIQGDYAKYSYAQAIAIHASYVKNDVDAAIESSVARMNSNVVPSNPVVVKNPVEAM